MEKLSSTETQSVNYESNFSRLLLIGTELPELGTGPRETFLGNVWRHSRQNH